MDDLRLILMLIGAGIVAVVYAWSRVQIRPRRSSGKRIRSSKHDSVDDLDAADIEQELGRMGQLVKEHDEELFAQEEERSAQGREMAAQAGGQLAEQQVQESERLLIISIVAAAGGHFSGRALINGFDNNRLRIGLHEIYHRMTIHSGREHSVFGVANMVKPGTFPAADMENFTTPGVTLFLELPGPFDALEAFDDFVQTAERLAVELGGELRDQQHRVLTHQVLMHWRESVAEDFPHRRVAS
jgi:cell division protein ZipA